jgi:glycosyltransferase involved in cell wall biosynthesis
VATQRIGVISHHRSGGGTPLDSLWYARNALHERGMDLSFHWALSPGCLAAALRPGCFLFDGVHALAPVWSQRLQTLLVHRRAPVALYWHETEYQLHQVRESHWLRRALNRRNLFHFHVCEYGLTMLERELAIPRSRLYKLANCAAEARLPASIASVPPANPVVAGCGKASERKGTDLFLQTCALVAQSVPQATFLWIGETGEGEFAATRLAERARELGIAERTTFTGPRENATEFIAQASVFFLSSRDDPMPKVLMESLALGKDIAAFGVGGVPELLGNHGTIVPPQDCAAAAHAIIAMLHAPATDAKRAAMQATYREQYTTAAFAVRFAEAFNAWKHAAASSGSFG